MLFERFEVFLDLATSVREEAVPKLFHEDLSFYGSIEEDIGAFIGFVPPLFIGTEHDPRDIKWSLTVSQFQDSTAATDL